MFWIITIGKLCKIFKIITSLYLLSFKQKRDKSLKIKLLPFNMMLLLSTHIATRFLGWKKQNVSH